jgi:hypothetical protein
VSSPATPNWASTGTAKRRPPSFPRFVESDGPQAAVINALSEGTGRMGLRGVQQSPIEILRDGSLDVARTVSKHFPKIRDQF